MLNIVIPMAGRGSRFVKAGFTIPKPMIPVGGVPMILLVIHNLTPRQPYRFIFLCLEEHIQLYQIDQQLKAWAPNCEIIVVDQVTEGAACTVLLAKSFINNEDPLMIANSDQWIDIDINDYLEIMNRDIDGLIMTMWADDPKWSFLGLDEKKEICEVAEKKVISNEATVGIYNFRRGKDFVSAAETMIAKNLRVNNEFYVAPVYNELIAKDSKFAYYNVGKEADGMYGLGIPSDLEKFERLPVVEKAMVFKKHDH